MARALNIVYVSWEFPPVTGGGIGPCVQALSRGLAQRGHDVTVITTTREGFPSRRDENGVTIVRLHQAPEPSDARGRLAAWRRRGERVARFLNGYARANPIDLVEFCDYRGEGQVYLAEQRDDRPVAVARLHTPTSVVAAYNPSQPREPALEEYEHDALRRVDAWLAPSNAVARETAARVGATKEIVRSPHPVDPDFLLQPPTGTSGDRNEALFVGRLEERKGVEVLIRAAERFLTQCPQMRLVLVGGDTPRSPSEPSMLVYLRGLIPSALRERIEFVGAVKKDELIARYRAARFCVFPSRFENFPNTCLEAMSLGKTIIAGANSGMAEMLEHELSGILVPSDDAPALARALIAMSNADSAHHAKLGAAARRRVDCLYAPAVVSEATEALYVDLVARRNTMPTPKRTSSTSCAQQPHVAIVIPCFNHGEFLGDAINSAKSQTYSDTEIVVVDDGSSDPATIERLDALAAGGVRVVRQENRGLSAARNAGVRATDAPFFVALDADDRLEPTFVERLLAPLLANTNLGYCYCGVRFFGAMNGEWPTPEYDPKRLLTENLSVATAVVRRRAFDEVGGYREDMRGGFEDWDFWIALLAQGYHGQRVEAPLFWYRKHASDSMLAGAQRLRDDLRRRMIAHQPDLFESMLGVENGQKATGAADGKQEELFESLLARVEVDAIERSRFWRVLRRFAGIGLPGWRHGADGVDLWSPREEDPRRRLERLKCSAPYRLISAIKATHIYDWYATRKYGRGYRRGAASARSTSSDKSGSAASA